MAPLVLVVFLLFLRFANVYLIRSFRWRLALGRFVSALQAYANLRRDDLRRYGAIIGVDAALMMPVCVGIMCIDQWFVKFSRRSWLTRSYRPSGPPFEGGMKAQRLGLASREARDRQRGPERASSP